MSERDASSRTALAAAALALLLATPACSAVRETIPSGGGSATILTTPGAPRAGPASRSSGALAAARRFLSLYVTAYRRPLGVRERRALRASCASAVADMLLEQPPEQPRRGGRLVGLSLHRTPEGGLAGDAQLRFEGLSERVRLTVAAYLDGSWRVTTFEPALRG